MTADWGFSQAGSLAPFPSSSCLHTKSQDHMKHIEIPPIICNPSSPIRTKHPVSYRWIWNYVVKMTLCSCPYAQALTVPLTDCLDSGSFHGPRWRMEPGDLFIPVDSIEEEATLTCDTKGIPPPQYRWERTEMKQCGGTLGNDAAHYLRLLKENSAYNYY